MNGNVRALPTLLGGLFMTFAPSAVVAAQNRNVSAALAQAEAAFERGDAAVAARAYTAVLDLDAEQPRALFRLAQLRREDPDAAVTLLQRYVRIVPSDAWGYLALADALARAGRTDAALQAYDDALSREPDDRDVRLGHPRLLDTLGRVDDAIDAFEEWLSDHPTDTEAWHELANVQQRAGRLQAAAKALERVREPSANDVALDGRIDSLRRRTAPSMQVGLTAIGETGASAMAPSAGVEFPSGDLMRVGVSYQRRRVTSFGDVAQGHRIMFSANARPKSNIRVNLGAGATWLASPRSAATAARQPELAFGARRTGPRDGMILDVKAQRNAIDVTPALMRAPVSRTQVGTSIDVPVGGPWRLRGQARTAALVRGDEHNRRTGLKGGAAIGVASGIRVAGHWHHTRNSNAGVQSYFAPRVAEVADIGLELERDYERLTIALDGGAGMQRFRRADELTMGRWAPALRVWGSLAWNLTVGQQLLVEFESYDSQVADAIVVSDRWRYASVTASLRLALR